MRIRLVKQSQLSGGIWSINDPTAVATYHVTGVSGSTLTGMTFESGTNQDFASGDLVAVAVCARDFTDIHARLNSGFINILQFGTVAGDGVTDDGPAIQAIITAHPGRKIFFPLTQASSALSYYSSITLNIASPGTQLIGESAGFQGGTAIGFPARVTGINIELAASGGSISDLILSGSERWEQVYPSQGVIPAGHTGSALSDATASAADGIRIGASLFRLTNVVTQYFGRHGFNFSNAQCGSGAVCDSATVISCYALNNRGYGLYVQGGDANACSFFNFNASVNQLGSVNDQSFLGNTYFGPKTDENHFDSGTTYSPSSMSLASITRASNVVTLTLTAPYTWSDPGGSAFVPGQGITVSGMTDATFNGTSIVASVSGSVITYSQTGSNATPSVTGATAKLATMRLAWLAAGLPTGGAFITSQSTASRTVLINPYTEGGQSPDGSGVGGMQLGSGTTVIGGIFGTVPDLTYGIPAIYMAAVPGLAQSGFYGSFPSVYCNFDGGFNYQEIVGATADYDSIRYRRSYVDDSVATLWTEKEGPGYYIYYTSNPLTDPTHSAIRLGIFRTVSGGNVTGGVTYLNSQGSDSVQINIVSGTSAACGTGGLRVGGPVACSTGITSTRPTSVAVAGSMFFDTTLGKPIWYNGSVWVDATGTPV